MKLRTICIFAFSWSAWAQAPTSSPVDRLPASPAIAGAASPPNAALDYWQAIYFLSHLDVKDRERLHSAATIPLDAEADALAQRGGTAIRFVDWGSRQPECDWGLHTQQEGLGTLMPHLGEMRGLAELGVLQARLDIRDRRLNDSVGRWRANLVLARHVASDGSMISALTGYAIQNLTVTAAATDLPRLESSQLQLLSRTLQQVPAPIALAQVLRYEQLIGPRWMAQRLGRADWERSLITDVGVPAQALHQALRASGGSPAGLMAGLKQLDPLYDGIEEALSLPYAEFDRRWPALEEKFSSIPASALVSLRSYKDFYNSAAVAQSRLDLFKAAIAVQLDGPAALAKHADAGGQTVGAFAYRASGNGFELTSAIKTRDGHNVTLEVGGNARAVAPVPAATQTFPTRSGTIEHPDKSTMAATRTPAQIGAETRAIADELTASILRSPDTLLNEAARQRLAPAAIPRLKQMLALSHEMVSARGGVAEAGGIQDHSTMALLAALGDAEAIEGLHRSAKEQGSVGTSAQAWQLFVRWAKGADDPSERTMVLDQLEALARANPLDANVPFVAMTLGGACQRAPQVLTRLRKIIAEISTGQAARELTKQWDELTKVHSLEGTCWTLEGVTSGGKPFTSADWKGKVVLVDFWATWCPPCRAELPRVKKLYADFHDRGLEVVGVSLDEDAKTLQTFLAASPDLSWPQILDAGGAMSKKLGVVSIPRMFLIDRRGVIRSVEGLSNIERLTAELLLEAPK